MLPAEVEKRVWDATALVVSNPQAAFDAVMAVHDELDHAASPVALQALMNLSRARYQQGRMTEALEFSARALQRLDETCTALHASRARNVHGGILIQLGQYAQALSILERASFDAYEAADTDMLGLVLVNQGAILALLGDHVSAVEIFLETQRLISDGNHASRVIAQSNIADTWLLAANAAALEGDADTAAQRARDAIAAARVCIEQAVEIQDQRSHINAVHSFARAAVLLGDMSEAAQALQRLLAGLGADLAQDPVLQLVQAEVALARGDAAQAQAMLQRVQHHRQVTDTAELQQHLLQLQERICEQLGDFRGALQAQRALTSQLLKSTTKVAQEQARRLRQAALEQREDTLAFLAHDMRAPLSAIVTLQAHPQDAAAPGRVRALAQQALELTDKFLAVARIESVQPRMFETLELGELTDSVCEGLRQIAQGMSKQLDLQPPWGLTVRGHRESLRRALTNLVQNAITAAPQGGTVRVAASCVEPGQAVELAVSDDGPGMPLHFQSILRRSVAAPAVRGYGQFGLTIVASVARTHGLRISVDASRSGTRVALRFPPGR